MYPAVFVEFRFFQPDIQILVNVTSRAYFRYLEPFLFWEEPEF